MRIAREDGAKETGKVNGLRRRMDGPRMGKVKRGVAKRRARARMEKGCEEGDRLWQLRLKLGKERDGGRGA